jgi:uncharacterized protein YndB with AHSA1/START domain
LAGPPVEIDMSVRIDAPPEVVWGYLVDWENLDQWMIEGKGFKVTSPHREGVGVTAEATIRIAGISTTDPVGSRVGSRLRPWRSPIGDGWRGRA